MMKMTLIKDDIDSNEMRVSAAVMGLIDNSDEKEDDMQYKEESSKLESYHTKQTETWKDVQINPELSEDKK